MFHRCAWLSSFEDNTLLRKFYMGSVESSEKLNFHIVSVSYLTVMVYKSTWEEKMLTMTKSLEFLENLLQHDSVS